jgi:hypothetical protein
MERSTKILFGQLDVLIDKITIALLGELIKVMKMDHDKDFVKDFLRGCPDSYLNSQQSFIVRMVHQKLLLEELEVTKMDDDFIIPGKITSMLILNIENEISTILQRLEGRMVEPLNAPQNDEAATK